MTDTQWPRYMVFQQHEPHTPLVHNGTVHAADAEMALLTARDVFSRRPRAVRMWVVPAGEIFSMTREEILFADMQIENDETVEKKSLETFHAFGKTYEQGQCEQFGEVEAGTHEQAMKLATGKFKYKKSLWCWVFPAKAVVSTHDDDIKSMFDPVLGKQYRDQSLYPVVTMMREIRAKRKDAKKDE